MTALAALEQALAAIDAAPAGPRVRGRERLDGSLNYLRDDPAGGYWWGLVLMDATIMWENATTTRPDLAELYRTLKRAAGDGLLEATRPRRPQTQR